MTWIYASRNMRPFSALVQNNYGRKVIFTIAPGIDANNIIEELQKAKSIHTQNATAIEYLDRYYRGDQPILYRQKNSRPEINNRFVQNLAYMLVESKASDIVSEPIQYVLKGTDENRAEELTVVNKVLEGEDKHFFDTELCRWRSICGTGYRFVGEANKDMQLLDESQIYLTTEDPRNTFVVYYQNGVPAFSCQIRKDANDEDINFIYTDRLYFVIKDDKIIQSGIHTNGAIPVVEYPNNARRLSDIEITIGLTDEINKMAADRSNGIEQFVSAWVKFVNCEIDQETFAAMRQEGALVVKSNNGSENKADVDVMTSELNQTESQVVVNDLYDRFLVIQGLASREGNTGGDTAGAVQLRNGHYDSEKRAELNEPIFKRSERMFIRLIINKLKVKGFVKDIMPSDIEIHINRTKMDNMMVKAEVLQMLLGCGIDYARAIKTIGLFSDPEQVASESSERMQLLYPKTKEEMLDGNSIEA